MVDVNDLPAPASMAQPAHPLPDALPELERSVYAALETYANVHRGSGLYSQVSTALFEQARDIVLDALGLSKGQYVVVFCTPRRAAALAAHLKPGSYQSLSSQDVGLPLGIRALAIKSRALPKGTPFQTGGGTARLVSGRWTIWADAPDKFEAGTPAIVNIIAFAKALQLRRLYRGACFRESPAGQTLPAAEILYHDALETLSGQELLEALRRTLIGCNGRVPTAEGPRPYINLDNGASTPTFTPIWEAARRAWRQPRPVKQEIVRETKAICAHFLGAPAADYDVIFTSNTTEALNLVAESLGREPASDPRPVVINTGLEHNSNELPWRSVRGAALVRLPIDAEGFVDLADLQARLRAYDPPGKHGRQRIRLVAVSGASNVLGTYADLPAIGKLAHRYGARLLVDAAQLVAHRPVDMQGSGVDYLAFSAHKAYAPFGSGALVVRKGLLNFSAAELEEIRASAAENIGGVAALGKALILLQRIGLDVIAEREHALTRHALEGLAIIPGVQLFGVQSPNSLRFAQKGGVITFSLRHAPHNLVAQELAELGGIGVRSGCFCAHLLVKRLLHMHPLRARLADLALLLAPRFASLVQTGLVRVSLGLENDQADVDALLRVLDQIARRPRTEIDRQVAAFNGGTLLPKTEIGRQMNDYTGGRMQRVFSTEGFPKPPAPAPATARACEARGR
jgi:selenocysteine lyase/cysteine desulfurase